ncbi:MAG: hypothetical protein NUV98_05100 [Candidatus Roizmanbacteria bacterium]|nr:hypothetical protein [Candidatus Roizmanbacteria bacterium]
MHVLSKLFLVSVLTVFGYWLVAGDIHAQVPACDLCGFCQGGEAPAGYSECLQCLYDFDLDPSATLPVSLPNPVADKSWTVIGCVETTPGGFVVKALQFVTTVAGGIIFVILLYGSFLVLTSAGDPVQLTKGKSLIRSGIVSLLLILFSVLILRFIGVTLLQIPGFE